MFHPVPRRESAVEACANALRSSILRGELAAGARLPPERELAATFGVNRLTLRAALAQLANAKLVSVRQGSGYLVRDYRRVGGTDLLAGVVAIADRRGDLATLAADLLALRRQLAALVLARVAEVRPEPGPIVAAVEAFAAVVASGAGPERLAGADLDVVAALLAAAGSAVYSLAWNPIAEVVSGTPALRKALYAEPETNLAGWRVLAAWIGAPRAEVLPILVTELERHDAATLALLPKRTRRASPRKGL